MSEEKEIEKSIEGQILDKTMEKLKQSELFPETLIAELKKIDLTKKESVKTALSAHEEDK
jgi:hypothetical protein